VHTSTIPNFKVHTFEGPLDLLLGLIEQQKLPINEIALAEVTEQFLEHLKTFEDVSPEILANFLTVAGKLLVIKSRSLLPMIEIITEEEDPAEDLAAQLLVLKQYREAARHLKGIENRKQQSFVRESFLGQTAVFFPDPNVTLEMLHDVAQRTAKSVAETVKAPEHKVREVISISQKVEHLRTLIRNKAEIALHEVLKNSTSKTEVIVTFLAVLELTKQRVLSVKQEGLFSHIVIKNFQSHE
jgi:segregation and condensation protein A